MGRDMKKRERRIGGAAFLLTAALLAGCASSKGQPDPGQGGGTQADAVSAGEQTPLDEMDVDQYVTLGDYHNLGVTVEEPELSQAEVLQNLQEIYHGAMTAQDGITDRAVELGDSVDIDYEGKKDGVAFDGGTAKGAFLNIGSGKFIQGFEEGLVGVMPGETVDLDLSFPENYGNAELAGQPVVFTVTVNYILPGEEGMKDSLVEELEIEGVATVEALRQEVYDYLYANLEAEYGAQMETELLDALVGQCTYAELPGDMLESSKTVFSSELQSLAGAYGMETDTFCNTYFGMSADTFAEARAVENVRQMLAMQAIANREGLKVSDEELEEQLKAYADSAGYDTVEEFVGEISKEDYRDYFMTEKVLDFLMAQHQAK